MLFGSIAGAAADCEALARLALPSARITEVKSVPAGDYNGIRNLPAFCRVAGVIAPAPDSDIKFEVWMPAAGWNQRFLGIGNGGYAGAINFERMFGGMAEAVRQGFAAASTDTGHSAPDLEASWALGHPEKVIDFGHRAIHWMTVHAKAIITAYYGAPPTRSYFSGCSNGGRQALMEAQRYPEDYDGLIAGAPAMDWTMQMAATARISWAMLRDPAGFIPPEKLPAIQAAVLEKCDRQDGVADGVVENPAVCSFDPGVLQCKGADAKTCLTQPQVATLRAIYGGLRDSKGKLLFPGLEPSGAAEKYGWGSALTGPAPEQSYMHIFSTNFFKYMVHGDPAWDYRQFDVTREIAAAQRMAKHLNATDPDLAKFRARGGKLILYHGWCDAGIPAQVSIRYYQSVVDKMGAKRAGEFVRLFLVPGMQHCWGGAGPNQFGQEGPPQGNAASNIGAALMRWVEEGVAPERIVAARPGRTRPLCAYPGTARYKGAGSTDDAASFECAP